MPFPNSLFDISCVILISKSENCTVNGTTKQINILWTKRPIEEKTIIILRDFIKQPVIKGKQNPAFYWRLYDCFFSCLIKAFVKPEDLIRFHHRASEAVAHRCSVKKVFLEISQNSFFRPQARNFIKKETLAQVLSCKSCKISKNPFSFFLFFLLKLLLYVNLEKIWKYY